MFNRKMLFDKPQAIQSVGLEQTAHGFRGVLLSSERGQPVLQHIYDAVAHSSEIKGLNDYLIITSLSSDEVLVRILNLQLKKEKDIDAVLEFQAEPLLPYPLEQALLDRIIVAQEQEGTRLTLFAVRKDHLQQHLTQWRALGIDPEAVTCDPAALALFSRHFIESKQSHFIVHVAKSQTACILVMEDKPLAVQSNHIGIEGLLTAATKDGIESLEMLERLDLTTVTEQSHPHVYEMLDQWRLEVTRLLYALSKQSKDQEISEFMIVGEGAALHNLDSLLARQANKKILPLTPPASFTLESPDKLRRFAVAIGAALNGLTLTTIPINFRQKEYAYAEPWKRLKKPLMLFGGACLLLAVTLFLFGQSYLSYQEEQIRSGYSILLQSMNKPYRAFEEEFQRKQRAAGIESETTSPPLQALSADQIEARLPYLQKDLQESPDIFPLQPNVPRVSDVLAWLSKHPQMLGNGSNGLKIESFNYSLVSRPDLKKKQEKYKVKVEMEFSSPTPKLAREFHDALVAPNDLVDPKGEVKWNSNRGLYRASFFLKDKTPYPASQSAGGV